MLIDIEVFNAQLDYNMLLGWSYIYLMNTITSSLFMMMMFPHEGKFVIVDQLTYYKKTTIISLDGIL